VSLNDTGPRIVLVATIALLLFVIAFFVARGGSSDAALAPVREERISGSAAPKHARLRAIGSVPALPRARRQPRRQRPSVTPPPVIAPAPAPPPPIAPPPPPPPPPAGGCLGETC
jgi:hypothetical protein